MKKQSVRLLLIFLILLTLVSIVLNILHPVSISNERLNRAVSNYVSGLTFARPEDGKDGRTPIKGVDYSDGANGTQGPVGDSGAQGATGSSGAQGPSGPQGNSGQDGVNGKDAYIELRCNEKRNRWEVRYAPDDNWSVLNNKAVTCTLALPQ